MTGRQISIAPERIAEGKRLYELTSTPVPAIATMMGVSRKTLERRIQQWGWVQRHPPRVEAERTELALPPAPVGGEQREPSTPLTAADADALRAANAARIQQLVAGSLEAVDRVLAKVGPSDEGGTERSARTLAAIARTLQDMSSISTPDTGKPQAETENDDDNTVPPQDIDEFRLELARRLQGIIATRRAAISAGTDGPAADAEPR